MTENSYLNHIESQIKYEYCPFLPKQFF